MARRTCRRCRRSKSLSKVHFDWRTDIRTFRTECKACRRRRQRELWGPAGSMRARLRPYGLTRAEYHSMRRNQRDRCAICRRKRPLVIDHCHRQLHVRALLCHRCNLGLGHFDDRPRLLRAAAAYLEL